MRDWTVISRIEGRLLADTVKWAVVVGGAQQSLPRPILSDLLKPAVPLCIIIDWLGEQRRAVKLLTDCVGRLAASR
jgi:hypothetical protein